jgi:hypothetical protein
MMLDEFRVFLECQAPVLHALRAWTLRLVAPIPPPQYGSATKAGPAADAAPSRGGDKPLVFGQQARRLAAPVAPMTWDERFIHAGVGRQEWNQHVRLHVLVTVVYLGIVDYHLRTRKTAHFSALVTWREPDGATTA